MKDTKIEWTDDSDNPIQKEDGSFYCFKVSEACDHCYAEKQATRISHMRHAIPQKFKKLKEYPALKLRRDMLAGWARQQKPKKHFVSSMTDIAGEFVPDAWFFEIMDAMHAAPLQTFQVLTKRAARFQYLCQAWLDRNNLEQLPINIWPGCSVENMRRAMERIPPLLAIPAEIHWISAEPLLAPLNLRQFLYNQSHLHRLNWVVTGGESGPHARISHPDWFRDLRGQCADAIGVAFFFKQWGEWHPEHLAGQQARYAAIDYNGKTIEPPDVAIASATQEMYRIGKKNAGHILDGHVWQDFPTADHF